MSVRQLKMKKQKQIRVNRGTASDEDDQCIGMFQSELSSKSYKTLWNDVKTAVYRRSARCLIDLEQFCKEEWNKMTK